jgi:hypothetical protein
VTNGLQPIFLRVTPADIALIKFIFESYEGVAVVRTLDRHDAIIVVLVSEDFLDVARQIIVSLREQVSFDEIPPPNGAGEDWLLSLLWDEM